MNDNLQPLPDEHLEARITAYVLGEASPFETAELEDLISKSPELQLFLNRTRNLHGLLKEAETTSNTPSEDWKLPAEKREKLDAIFDEEEATVSINKESRIRRASFRAGIGIAAIFVITLFTIRLVPWDYEAEAIIEVIPRGRTIDGLSSSMGSENSQMTANFFGTEFEKIKSRNTLGQVIDELDLTTKWGIDRESALNRLKGSIETKNLRGTDLLSIRVSEKDEQDALDITESVVRNYKEYRSSLEEKNLEKGIEELKKAVREQEDKVQERRKVLTTISRTKDIVYAGVNADAKKAAVEENIDNQDYLDAKRDFETEQALLERMKLKLISGEIDAEIAEESIVIHDEPSIRRRSLLSLLPSSDNKDAAKESVALAEIAPPQSEIAPPSPRRLSASEAAPKIFIGGQVRTTGPLDFKEGITLGEAVASAGGATEFGSKKRVKVYRDGKTTTYDLTDERLASIELQPGDTIEMPQKNWFGCGADRDELVDSEPTPEEPQEELAELTGGLRSGDAAITRDSIDAILNNPDRTVDADSEETVTSLTGTFGLNVPSKEKQSEMPDSGVDAFAPEPSEAPVVAKPTAPASAPVRPVGGAIIETDKSTGDLDMFGRVSFGDGDDFGDGWGGMAGETWDSSNGDGEVITAGSRRGITEESESLDLAQREMLRRQEAISEADKLLLGGRDAYANGDYAGAIDELTDALEKLPESPATEERRRSIEEHLEDASIVEAQKLRKVGKYDEARELLEKTPPSDRIKEELGHLDDPIRTNPAMAGGPLSEEHSKQVEQVRRSLYTAEGNYNLGKFDDAVKAYEDTLRIDPYNKAARRGLEKVANAKSDYYRAAYDQTRSELLAEVDAAWELGVPEDEDFRRDMEGKASEKTGYYRAAYDQTESSEQKAKGYDWSFDRFAETTGSGGSLSARPPIILTEEPGVVEFEGFMNYGNGVTAPPEITSFFDSSLAEGESESEEFRFAWQTADESFKIAPEVEVVREFTYPTEYLLPELANNEDGATIFPVTPATPTTFEALNDGLGDVPMLGRLFKAPEIDLADLSEEILATEEPFSTFSLNISDASFQIARAAMEKGEQPDPAAIKPEQFYNAVDYGDPAPTSLEPVAAAIDQTAHPIIPGRNLVRVALRTASTGRSAAQPLRLTLLVDQSGSMVREDRRAAMETALEQLATLLTENDEVTVIGFSRTPRLLADSLPGDQAEKLSEIINQTANEGGTNLEQAITLASELALRHKLDSAQNRIVLFTDGAANLGNADPERLSESIESLRQQSISFDVAGIGATDLNDNLLAELARHGNGRYYLVDENTGASLAAQLAGAFRPAAENVKVQVALNPNRVGNYKLIGFEKDRLKTEDFRNDSVDAAELAADEAGVAMYQVETLPDGTGEIGEVSVRFRETSTGNMVERTWTIPYDSSAPAIDKADEKTQLATLSLLAAQKLQGGPLADAINLRNFSETLARLKQTYAKDEKTTQMLTFIDSLK